ncbi:hypothetical protein [Streptomyces sp. NPDC057557]|uniref:hypothetical protein n=1 Tax=Streptomyces sp. NPDC057557 TaxID=3346167 RepID=UPI0036B7ECF3
MAKISHKSTGQQANLYAEANALAILGDVHLALAQPDEGGHNGSDPSASTTPSTARRTPGAHLPLFGSGTTGGAAFVQGGRRSSVPGR